MTKTEDGSLILDATEIDGLNFLLLQTQKRAVDIHYTTFSSVDKLVNEWERLMGPLPDIYR